MHILHDVLAYWLSDWRNNRRLFWMELFGVLFNALATATMSFMASHPPMLFCYAFWFIGSGMLMVTSYIRRSSWILCLMTFYTLMNIVGLVILVLK